MSLQEYTEQTVELLPLTPCELRRNIKNIAFEVDRAKKNFNRRERRSGENVNEVLANYMLCYRHLEDASMRLGKVLQHLNNGEPAYDRNVVGDPRHSP